MSGDFPKPVLRVGFVGSGFIAHFHLKALLSVRNVEVTGIYSRSAAKRDVSPSIAVRSSWQRR